MAEITKQYTYKLPDTYFGNTWAEEKTASAMYTGPQEGFVFVNTETGELFFDESFHPIYETWEFTEEEVATTLLESLQFRCGPTKSVVRVNASNSNEETIIAATMQGIHHEDWPDKEYAFPDGHPNAGEVYHVDPDPLPINDSLDVEHGIKYDFETETWSLDDVKFLDPYCTEERHTSMLQGQKEYAIALKERDGWTAEQEAELDRFIAECDAVPTKFAGIHWLMIKFPELDNNILFPSVEEPAGDPEDGDAAANAMNEAAAAE